MSDLIDRQAAIDALMEQFKRNTTTAIRAKMTVEAVPSAQPETEERTAESVQNVSDSDLISRKAAINAFFMELCFNREREYAIGYEGIEKIINGLPSAQPELIEKTAYIRGFEQGRTQGMIDAQGGKQ